MYFVHTLCVGLQNSQGILNFRYSNQSHYLRGKLNVAVVKAKVRVFLFCLESVCIHMYSMYSIYIYSLTIIIELIYTLPVCTVQCFTRNIMVTISSMQFVITTSMVTLSYHTTAHVHTRCVVEFIPLPTQLEGAGEYYLEDLSKESSHVTEKVWALIDVEKQLAYGMKVC